MSGFKQIFSGLLRHHRIIRPTSCSRPRGLVALSYLTEPFQKKPSSLGPRGHTNWQESQAIVDIWNEAGFDVEIANYKDRTYEPPRHAYAIIDIHPNLERWKEHPARWKILHATGAHWITQNRAEWERLEALRDRRGISLIPRRIVSPSRGAESATLITYLGNEFTAQSFQFAKKPLKRIPISSAFQFDVDLEKNFEKARRNFLWIGSYGMVHKGLDLVLEAFAGNPDIHLTICGRPEKETDFFDAYREELLSFPNIHLAGWTDMASQTFKDYCRTHIGIVYPSCSEGGAGSVIHAMHAGLIPICTKGASVDLGDFGIPISAPTPGSVATSCLQIAESAPSELSDRVNSARKHVLENHTLENFRFAYRALVTELIRQEKP